MRILSFLSCGAAVIYMAALVMIQQAGFLSGFWDGKPARIALGIILCLFPLAQGGIGLLIRNPAAHHAKKMLKTLLAFTILHLIITLVLGAFLFFPLPLAALDFGWMLVIRKHIKKKPAAVKKLFETLPPVQGISRPAQAAAQEEQFEEDHFDPAFLALINSPNTRGFTPLMVSILEEDFDTAALLIDEPGLDINTRQPDTGNTALSYAAWNGQREIVQRLLAREEIVADIMNYDGLMPADMAKKNGHFDLADLIARHGV